MKWELAKQQAIDELESVAFTRAKKYSDTLLIFLLKALKPDVYRDSSKSEVVNTGEIIVKIVRDWVHRTP